MTMGIYVPSCDRTENIGFGVARFASPELQTRMVYVVPEDQRERYEKALSLAGLDSRVLGCPERGIARTRLWIGNHAGSLGEKKFLMMDDDIWFYTRTTDLATDFHLEYSRPEQVNAMIAGGIRPPGRR